MDGTVILTNFVPSDAATIGRRIEDMVLSREEGRKLLSFQFRGRTADQLHLPCVYDD